MMEVWIREGRPLRSSIHGRNPVKSALELAVVTGFQGMVEMLLEKADWTSDELAKSLAAASSLQRIDLIEMLLEAGASVENVNPKDIIASKNEVLILHFLQKGMRLNQDDAFFKVLDEESPSTLVRFYQKYRKRYPELEDQAARAMASAARKQRFWWFKKLLQACVDPDKEVPIYLIGEPEEPGCGTTARKEAYYLGDLSALKRMGLKTTPGYADIMLWRQSLAPDIPAIERILEFADSKDLNSKPGPSSAALEVLISLDSTRWGIRDHRTQAERSREIRQAIQMILKAGGRWDPDLEDFGSLRRSLSSHGRAHVAVVIRLLLDHSDQAPIEKVWELARTAKMKNMIWMRSEVVWKRLVAEKEAVGI